MTPDTAPSERPAESFLGLIGTPGRRPADCHHIMAVFAHPDDETIAIGGQIWRLNGIAFVHVTDGAPSNLEDALANGFSSREDYAAARRQEIIAALGEAGVPPEAVLSLGAVDQEAAFQMPRLVCRLADIFRTHRTAVVITHAYEGGHPDHDATAFIVHAAAQLIINEADAAPEIVECPLYHRRNGRRLCMEFTPAIGGGPEIALKLSRTAVRRKRRMMAAHITQQRMLTAFAADTERFRLAPHYDFSELPNGGELLYEDFDWGLDGKTWLRLTLAARRELGLPQWL